MNHASGNILLKNTEKSQQLHFNSLHFIKYRNHIKVHKIQIIKTEEIEKKRNGSKLLKTEEDNVSFFDIRI